MARHKNAFLRMRGALRLVMTSCLWLGTFVMISSPLLIQKTYAMDDTWVGAVSGDWNDVNNWFGESIPTGIATFNTSANTALTLSAPASLNELLFNPGANAFVIDPNGFTFTLNGIGVTNNSLSVQTFDITAGTLVFNNNATADTVSIENGDTIEFHNSSTANNAKISNAVNVVFFDSSTAGSSIINNILTGVTTFNNSSTAGNSTISNAPAGQTNFNDTSTAGTSVITNNGLINFNSTASSGGATVINNGGANVNLGANTIIGSLSGAGNVSLGANNLTTGGLNTSVTISGVISGAGSLTKTGTGTLTLSGTNTYTGPTTINAGILSISEDPNLGNGGTLILDGGTLQTTASLLSTRPVTLNAGGGAFLVNTGSSFTSSGNITGAGTFQKLGAGNLTLTGVNNIAGGITNSAGTLTGNTVSLNSPTINNAAALVFNQTTDASFAGVITGVGTFQKLGTGNLTLTGINNIAGGITNSAGTLTGNAASLNSPTIKNTANLVFSQITPGTYSGIISGTGNVTIQGDLTFSAVSPYSGTTSVNPASVFTLNGSLPNSAVTVANGATIKGTGSMKSLALEGTIAPGNSIGTLIISNDFIMSSTARYEAEVSQTGTSDLIAIGGKAQLNGTLDVISADSTTSLSGQSFTILAAESGVTGTFNATEFNNGSNLTNIYNVNYNSNTVTITFPMTIDVAPLNNAAYRTAVLTNGETVQNVISTQQQTARDGIAYENSKGTCPAFAFNSSFDKLVQRQKSLALNGQDIMRSASGKRNYVDTPEVQTRIIPLSERIKIGKTNVWFQNYDQVSWLKGTSQSPGVRSKTFGGVMGADYEIFKNTFFGLFAGSSSSPIHIKSNAGSGRVKSYYGGLYATHMNKQGFYVDGQITAGGNNYHAKRNINFGNFTLKALSKHNGGQFFSRVEIGQIIPFPAVVFLPFINVGYGLVHEQASTEKGAGRYNFAMKEQNSQAVRGEVGTRIYRTYLVCETLIRPEFDISYILTRGVGSNNGKGNFVGDPQTLSLSGGHRTFNQVAPAFSLSALFKGGLYVIGAVRGQLGSTLKTVSGTATVGYNF